MGATDTTSAVSTATRSELKSRSRGLWRDAFQQLLRNPGSVAGLVILIALALMGITAPYIAPAEPNVMVAADALHEPSAKYPFGTDQFGRDNLSRIMHGARLSFQVGFVAVSIAFVCGVSLGIVSGYYGKWIDGTIGIVIDIMLAFPGILLALAIVAILGPSLLNLMVAVGIAEIPRYTRLIRGQVLSARELQYVDAARVIGAPDPAIMFRHILPNVLAPAIVLATLGIGGAILVGAALSFLGLGAKPPTAEWGAMLECRPKLPPAGLVDHVLPRAGDHDHRPVDQPAG